VDVVMSTTALHWLEAGTLFALYRRVARLLRPGGIFLNGDNMPFESWQVSCDRLATEAFDRERREAFVERGVPDWDRWWTEASTVDTLASAIAERAERRARAEVSYGIREGTRLNSLATHTAALSQAGFADVGTVWQHLDDRVLLAVR
jgi:SAM-dependent methyltransferase